MSEEPPQLRRDDDPSGTARNEFGDPVSEATFPILERYARTIARTQESLREAFARVTLSSAFWLGQIKAQIDANWTPIIEPALRIADFVGDAVQEAMPSNWRDLRGDDLGQVLRLAESGLVSLVWAPRAEIAVELGKATTQAHRELVLVARRDEILEDVATILGESAWMRYATRPRKHSKPRGPASTERLSPSSRLRLDTCSRARSASSGRATPSRHSKPRT